MFAYYLKLARRSLKRNKVLTALMILTIAIGIGATMTTLTVYRVLSGDPIPAKSDVLYRVQVDSYPKHYEGKDDEPPGDLTRLDAEDLLADGKAFRQTITNGGDSIVELPGGQDVPGRVATRHANSDFFAMFDVPIKAGRAWTKEEDNNKARVTLINHQLAEKKFGDKNPIGQTINIGQQPFQIIGVVGEWKVSPRFYDLASGRFSGEEKVYVPYSTARELNLSYAGNMDCNARIGEGQTSTDRGVKCNWLNYWVELPDAAARDKYMNYLTQYSQQKIAEGWFSRPPNARLRNVMEWLDFKKVVPSDVRLQLWLALGFLLVCMVNVVGLLLAKFLRRSGEIGVRRALGATKSDVFRQFLTESALIGVAGGVLGLVLAWLGLLAVRHQPVDYASLAKFDPLMLITTIVLSVIVTLLAGALPAWRAMRISPSIQLKSQ